MTKATKRVSTKTPKKKRGRIVPPSAAAPHACAILTVDAAETSGFAAWDRGNLRWYGECDVFGDAPLGVLQRFLQLPGPHVLVVERPFRVQSASSTGIGTGERIWREHAKRLGFATRIVRVYPSSWRSRALGKGWGNAKRAIVRPKELEVATAIVVAQLGPYAPAVGDDSAPAIVMGKWASTAGEVFRVLPKRTQRAVSQLELLTVKGAAE